MGSNRGWWSASEFTSEEAAAKYRWYVVRTILGVKVLKNKDKENGPLPVFSNTKNTKYLHQNSAGGIDQLRVFVGRHSFFDIDWGHTHGGIPKGVAHVQKWVFNPVTQKMDRIETAHTLSDYMWKKYGPIILKANPNVKQHL